MTGVLLRFGLRVAGATALGLAVVAAVVGLVGALDGNRVSASRLLGQVLVLSPLIATVAAGLSVAGLRVRGELVVLSLSGRHPGGWSLAAAAGACGLVAGLLVVQAALPSEPGGVEHVALEADGVWWRSADGEQVVRLGASPAWSRGGQVVSGTLAPSEPAWRALRATAGPGDSLTELVVGGVAPDRRAWALLVGLLPFLAGACALVGALAETMATPGRSLGALAATGSIWLLIVAATVLSARGGLPVGAALAPMPLILALCSWLWAADARYSATM